MVVERLFKSNETLEIKASTMITSPLTYCIHPCAICHHPVFTSVFAPMPLLHISYFEPAVEAVEG